MLLLLFPLLHLQLSGLRSDGCGNVHNNNIFCGACSLFVFSTYIYKMTRAVRTTYQWMYVLRKKVRYDRIMKVVCTIVALTLFALWRHWFTPALRPPSALIGLALRASGFFWRKVVGDCWDGHLDSCEPWAVEYHGPWALFWRLAKRHHYSSFWSAQAANSSSAQQWHQ